MNKAVLNKFGEVKPLTANIYIDDILGASVFEENTTKLLATIIEAIFLVCKKLDVAIRKFPLFLKN